MSSYRVTRWASAPDLRELQEAGRISVLKAATPGGEVAVPLVRKPVAQQLAVRELAADGDPRVRFDVVASTAALDSYGDVIEQDGWELARYRANPVLLVDHRNSVANIAGHGEDVRVEDDALQLVGVLDDERNEAATMAGGRILNGSLRTVSVGFVPLAWEKILDEQNEWTGGFRFLQHELLEVSLVAIPANPEAVITPRNSAGTTGRTQEVAVSASTDAELLVTLQVVAAAMRLRRQ